MPGFRVLPYLMDPRPDGMTLRWVADQTAPGRVECAGKVYASAVRPAPELAYGVWEVTTFGPSLCDVPLFLHQVQVRGLAAGQTYAYQVTQGGDRVRGELRTPGRRVRFVVYADSEVEPEGEADFAEWECPGNRTFRPYLVTKAQGYVANLAAIRARQPDFVVLAGDLVQCGGEQRDWDAFWRQNRHLAARTPYFCALGNHDYYAGPEQGGYQAEPSERAVAKHLSYFHGRRYFRADYGPVRLVVLDVCRGFPPRSERDTNHWLKDGSQAPDFNPGSEQYRWLEQQLDEPWPGFTFVVLHHCPFSTGIHGRPTAQDKQSGQPVRALLPLLASRGVAAVFSGHDEMLERSEYQGMQIYCLGIGGDGLCAPYPETENPLGKFLAHRDSPEVWKDGVLQDGGKHYGHLEVEVCGDQATLTPAYVFPVLDRQGRLLRFERRVYPDILNLTLKGPGARLPDLCPGLP